ncbi:MAG: glycoside hydrolase family 25 protein, partial [Clostridiales bacterium]|nr:glycoside hydrolase family 25 protein [Clostridiales bacterium]
MAKVTCIDVSYYQSEVDYAKVKSAGITAVIIRAGYGRETTQKDKKFETHYKNAKAAGLKTGAYWYSYAVSEADAKKEAAACLSCIKGKSFELPVYYDMEDSSMTSLGKTTLTKIAKAFCEAIKSGGYRAGVYANLNWFNNYLDYSNLKKSYSIWLAQYAAKNGKDCDIWQNSSTGKISGISGNVDTNVILNSSIISGSSSSGSSSAGTSTAKAAVPDVTYR